MATHEVVEWYNKFSDTEITDSFIRHMVDIGMVSESDTMLEDVNRYLLMSHNGKYVVNNGKYVVKDNRRALINSFKDPANNSTAKKKQPIRFKLQKIGNNKLTLTKK